MRTIQGCFKILFLLNQLVWDCVLYSQPLDVHTCKQSIRSVMNECLISKTLKMLQKAILY